MWQKIQLHLISKGGVQSPKFPEAVIRALIIRKAVWGRYSITILI